MISPDSKQVAYLWYNDRGDKGYYELRLMRVGDTSYKNLYSCSKNEYMVPELWSSDSKKIIVQNYIGNTIWQLCSIDITSGEVQVLKEKTPRPLWIPNVSLSPDNKYLAFDYSNPSDKNNYDIYLMPVDSKDELPLIEHQANDRLLGWLPGTNELFFISDRSGNWNLYAVPVDKGKPSGPVKRIYGDIGEADPMGFTYSGDCFLGLHRNIYTNDILLFNAETGVVEEESGKSLAGSINFVKWSPDGQYLAYTKNYIQTNIPWHLTIRYLKTGEERQVANNLATAHSLSWSPDGNSILVIGHDRTKFNIKGYKGGIFLVNAKTGQAVEILNISDYKYNANEDETFPLSDVEWSPDGKSFFYTFFTDRLVRHDLESGEEKILYKHDRFVRSILQRSPDGKNLLFGVYNQEKHKSYLMTVPVEGGKEKEICTSQEAPSFNSANWSPDGKLIYFIDSNGNNFWRVSAEGGMPQNIWSSKDWILRFSIHPNGKQLIIEKPKGITELRVIENLAQELERLDKLAVE
jgi:Tol biopolymer transport system component